MQKNGTPPNFPCRQVHKEKYTEWENRAKYTGTFLRS